MLAFKRALAKQEGSKEGVEALKGEKPAAEAVKSAASDHPLPHARLGDPLSTKEQEARRHSDGKTARSIFGHPHQQKPDLLGNARKAGLMESPAHKVTGEASMRIDLRGFPLGNQDENRNERHVFANSGGAWPRHAARKSGQLVARNFFWGCNPNPRHAGYNNV